MKTGREQTEALTALMNGLMVRMQESADQNLGKVRVHLTMVVSDLAEKVGSLVSVHVIPRPHGNVDAILPLGRNGATAGAKAGRAPELGSQLSN